MQIDEIAMCIRSIAEPKTTTARTQSHAEMKGSRPGFIRYK
jgi:hypothetical protein